jgi:O-glycosyl hydrolase
VRRVVILFAVVALVAGACSSSKKNARVPETTTTIAVRPGTPTVKVDAEVAQTINGFGASGAWWPIDLAKFPDDVQQQVAGLLFDPNDGIALSGYRYNIGGGGKGVKNPSRAPNEVRTDEAGRTFLHAAFDAHVPLLTGFVNSAPPQFTTNGQACGGALKSGQEQAFADYLVGAVRYLHDVERIDMQYVSPMNEPDDSFGDCGQEGMQVPVGQRAALVNALARGLERDAPYAKVIADETTADAILANEAPQWLGDAATNLVAIAHHTYDFPNDALRKLVPPVAQRFNKPTWMTETCCYKGSGGVASSFGAQYDPTMTQGFWLADQIYDDLTIAGDSAWYWWTALSSVLGCDPKADDACPTRKNTKGFNDGLLYYDENGPASDITKIFTTKRFFVLGQFSRYVRPGAKRYDVNGAPNPTMVFENDDHWSVVTWNESKTDKSFVVSLPGTTNATLGVQTNDRDELSNRSPAARTSAGWLVTVPAGTIATYVFAKSAEAGAAP